MTTRSKRKSALADKNTTTPNKRVENSWISLIKESLFENSNFSIITLPHPGHNKPTKYCLDNIHKKVYEVLTFSEPYRSWFTGEAVKSDGSLQMMTPVNPLFLVLPRLKEQCCQKAIPLEDLLSEKGFNELFHFIDDIDSIADRKGPADMKAYRYNEEKTLTWLEERVRRLAKVLREKNMHVTSGAISATFLSSNLSNESVNEEFFLKYAHGIISEYLHNDLIELLVKRFDFKPDLIDSIGNKRKSEVEESVNKKLKCEPYGNCHNENDNSNTSFINEEKIQKPLTAKEKARQKAATGTKTISSFFTKQSIKNVK